VDVTIRSVSDEEFPAFCRSVETAFGHQATDEEVADWHSITEIDRTLAVFEDGRIVGTAAALSLELTLPGGVVVPAAGITAVGVRPSHRRRGLLRAMMDQQLDDVARGHEALAILTASESVIYGRFGYGVAAMDTTIEIDPRSSRFAQTFDDPGRIDLIEPHEIDAVIPAIHDRARRSQPGDINRTSAWWDLTIRDPEWARTGLSKRFWAVHRGASGEADGYLAYRVKQAWREGLPDSEIQLDELVALDDTTDAALWRFVLDLDLASRITASSRPLDEALRWRLADPRRLRVTAVMDQIWARLLDVPAALSARRYAIDAELVFEVRDGFRPGVDGRYALRGGPDGAECERTSRPPDLTVGIAELSAAYFGQPRFSTFGRAARAEEHRAGALQRADVLFGGEVVPFSRTGF
jgi:predicted acetyltransferase